MAQQVSDALGIDVAAPIGDFGADGSEAYVQVDNGPKIGVDQGWKTFTPSRNYATGIVGK